LSSGPPLLQFAPWVSAPKVGFWQRLGRKKLEEWRLDDEPKEIQGSWFPGSVRGLPPRLELVAESIDGVAPGLPARGEVRVLNTLKDLKDFDKKKAASDLATKALDDDDRGLATFLLLVHADVKAHRYTYWFLFPALVVEPPVTLLSKEPLAAVLERNGWREPPVPTPQALLRDGGTKKRRVAFRFDGVEARPLFSSPDDDDDDDDDDDVIPPPLPEGKKEPFLYCCYDPSTTDEPGWPVRNLVALLRKKLLSRVSSSSSSSSLSSATNSKTVKIACLRSEPVASFVIEVNLFRLGEERLPSSSSSPVGTGWERDSEGRHRPRRADLAPLADVNELATSAANLNLHLMRWRLLPSLDVEALGRTKCLLLGAGTLGCQVARGLVGWGVRHVTFVDNGAVSYSNPARQSLYTVADASRGARKAETAAKALYGIAPGTAKAPSTFTGVDCTIPTPGRSNYDDRDVDVIAQLIDAHDVVFVLTDTREARWLPTVLATASKRKPTVVNVGLGLDSYVVVRHGAGADLGCYFCNDVVAPGDSTKDRTLDQQCTVSRPGLAPVASAVAVELAVALLHHPLRHAAPPENDQKARTDAPLGILPHSIRGFLTHFKSLAITTRKFPKCSACSDPVVDRYRKDGAHFVRQVAHDPSLLETISGLADLAVDDDFLLEDDDDLLLSSSSSSTTGGGGAGPPAGEKKNNGGTDDDTTTTTTTTPT